jgi:hypothetical protein
MMFAAGPPTKRFAQDEQSLALDTDVAARF